MLTISAVRASQMTPFECASSSSVKKPACPSRTEKSSAITAETVVVKEEDANRPMLGIAVEMNLVVQRVAHLRQFGAEGHLAAQQPVDTLALVDKVGAQV